jgi:lipopolysaccharide/colanic/teichoic acid biosynthesis glycosyltransferase
MMPHDLEYLLNYNVWLDVKILLATVPAVLWGTGAV